MGGSAFGLLASLAGRRFGIVGILVVVGAFFLYSRFSSVGDSSQAVAPTETQQTSSDERVQFTSFVLDDVQDTWTRIFTQQNRQYARAKMVIFENATSTGCGYGESATGPFYCPLDQQVYLDLSFFRTLERGLGASGDFAQAYVIAHEVGHHVQHLSGAMKRGGSIALELQADCYAGVWAAGTKQRDLLEKGDLEEALGAAAAVGDDRLQERDGGTVQPEKWTHGSAKERAAWFRRGYDSGDPASCDTFKDASAQR
jgi:predicted metalloprotease